MIRQLIGLAKKDWYWMRTEICLGLGFYTAGLLLLPLLLHKTLAKNYTLHELVIGMSTVTVTLGLFISGFVLIWLLQHDMKRPDIWLHTPAGSLKLFGVKILLSGLVGIAFLFCTCFMITMTYFISGAAYSFTQLIKTEMVLFAGLAYFPFSAAFMGLNFWMVYYLLRLRLGRISILIALVAFGAYTYIYTKVMETDLYIAIFNSGAMDIGGLAYQWGDFSFEASGFLFAGDLLFDILLNLFLVTLAIILFNKKVRC